MEGIEQMKREPWYIEWRERRDRELEVKAEAFWKEEKSEGLFEPSPERKKYKSRDLFERSDDGKSMKSTHGRHVWCSPGVKPIEYYHRFYRAYDARGFLCGYNFVQGEKSCITSDNSWKYFSNMCLDSTWLAVHGAESICMVTWRKDVDMTRVDPFYQDHCTNQQTMRSYATSVISEVECLPYDDTYNYNDDDLSRCVSDIMEKPFGVVSLVPDNKQASSNEYDLSKATMFLAEKMNSGLAFTIDETIQTAISAFQHMCRRELKAEDIWVTTLSFSWGIAEHLRLDKRKEYLAVISGGSSSGCSGSFAVAPLWVAEAPLVSEPQVPS